MANSRPNLAVVDHYCDREAIGRPPNIELYRTDPGRWVVENAIASEYLFHPRFGTDVLNQLFLTAFLRWRSHYGSYSEWFSVRIVYPTGFPDRGITPRVYLMSHRDRWLCGHDSHIEPNFRLCLFVPADSPIDFTKADSLLELLATTITFLCKEIIYQRDLRSQLKAGPKAIWPGEDRAHGAAGLVQSIRDRGGIRFEEPCVCGSGREYNACCKSAVSIELQQLKEQNHPHFHDLVESLSEIRVPTIRPIKREMKPTAPWKVVARRRIAR